MKASFARMLKALAASLNLVLALGLLQPASHDAALEKERFWVMKTHASWKNDMVIMGDSRIYRGVSPQEMESILAGWRILNFGYSSGGLNKEMFKEAEARLDPKSSNKTIILGISPHSLTPSAEKNTMFREEKARSKTYIFLRRRAGSLLRFFQPVDIKEFVDTIRNKIAKKSRSQHELFFNNGWVESWDYPERKSLALKTYATIFSSNQVSPKLVDGLIQQVREWTRQGIQVYGFRPPSCPEMAALENEKSGFSEPVLVKRFQEAGGIWLPFTESYHSYDGCHLHARDARKLSREMAMMIKTGR